jgi:hypothetical protein
MAEIISEGLGTQVRFQQSTFDAYKGRFISFGMSEAMAQGLTGMAAARNQDLDNAVRRRGLRHGRVPGLRVAGRQLGHV